DSFLLYLNALSYLPDIVLLSETWIYSNETNLYNIENYNSFFECGDSYRSGGLACFIHSRVQNYSVKSVRISTSCILINLLHINILCIYRSPSGNKEIFINALEVFLRTHTNNLLIVG